MNRKMNQYWIAALLLAFACGIASAAEDVNKLYASGFGDKDAAVRATHNPHKAAAFARELLDSAEAVREDAPYQALLFGKAYEFGMLYPDGVSISIEAMEQLSKTSPEAKAACDERLLNALYKQFQTTVAAQRQTAAGVYVGKAMEIAASMADAGKYDAAIAVCTKALGISPLPPETRAQVVGRLEQTRDEQATVKRIAELKATLKVTSRDINASTELVRLLVFRQDRPDLAVEYLPATADEKLKRLVPLAAKDVTELSEEQLMELAAWYRSQVTPTAKFANAVEWNRAKACYQQLLAIHTRADAEHINATRGAQDATEALAKLPVVALRGPVADPKASDSADPLQTGTIWSHDSKTLTILERKGDTVRARFEVGPGIRMITGVIHDGKFSWLSKDVEVIRGGAGGDNIGTINGDQLDFQWHDEQGGGAFTLYLDKTSLTRSPAVAAGGPASLRAAETPDGAVDLLGLVDLKRDVLRGPWEKRADGLTFLGSGGDGLLRSPYRPPAEYDLQVEFTIGGPAIRADEDFRVGILAPSKGSPCTALARQNRGKAECWIGQWIDDHPIRTDVGVIFESARRYRLVTQVRANSTATYLDGTLIARTRTDAGYKGPPPPWEWSGEENTLGLACAHRPVLFHHIGVDEITGKGKVIDLAPLGVIPTLSKAPPNEGPLRVVDLIPLIDPSRDTVKGKWTRRGNELLSDGGMASRIRINYDPPEEYNLLVTFTRSESSKEICQILSHEGHSFSFNLGDLENSSCSFQNSGRQKADALAGTLRSPVMFMTGRKYNVVIYVRKGMVAASVDGRLIVEYPTDFSKLRLSSYWDIGPGQMGIGSDWTPTVFHTIEIAEITGQGKRVPAE